VFWPTDGEVGWSPFASFRDFDNDQPGQVLSLHVSLFWRKSAHVSGKYHFWTLSDAENRRQRSIALLELLSPKAVGPFWTTIAGSSAPNICHIIIPVAVLHSLLSSTDAQLFCIESLEVEFVTGITMDLLRDVRHRYRHPITLPKHLEPEMTPKLLPALPRLKKLVLRSRFTDSERIRLDADSVVEMVQAFCPDRVLAVLDVFSIRTDRWSSDQIMNIKKVTGKLVYAELRD